MRSTFISVILLAISLGVSTLYAQTNTSTPPDKNWTGAFGAGFSLTGGNTDTANFNLSFNGTYDPKTRNVIKTNGLYLRSDKNNEKTADRLRLGVRDEYTLSDRVFLFGDMTYLRDPFKEISYLLNPYGGVGYKLLATERVSLALDGGAGVVWEKNPAFDTDTSGTLNAGQNLAIKLSEGAQITQQVTGLWKTDNFQDALYHFAVGVATQLTKRMELKVEFIDDFKNVTPNPDVKKNDTAFLTSFLFTF